MSDCRQWGPEVKVKQEEEDEYPSGLNGSSSSAQQQQWQANLLDHIESVQDEVCHRMDFIEKELDGELELKSQFSYYGSFTDSKADSESVNK